MELFDVFREMSEHDAALTAAGVSPEERSLILANEGIAAVDRIPGMRLDKCGRCGGNLLIDVGTHQARCTAGCGWTGYVLRRLP